MSYLDKTETRNLAAWHKARDHKRFRSMNAWTKKDGTLISLWSYYKRVVTVSPSTKRIYLDATYWNYSVATTRQVMVFLKTVAPDCEISAGIIKHWFSKSNKPSNMFVLGGWEFYEIEMNQ